MADNHSHHDHIDFELPESAPLDSIEEGYANGSARLMRTDEIDVDNFAFTANSGDLDRNCCTKRRSRNGVKRTRSRQSIRNSVRLLSALSPHKYDHRDELTLRVHSVWSYLTIWGGSALEYSWPKVLAYTIYLTVVAGIFTYGCPRRYDVEEMAYLPMRCQFGDTKLKYEEIYGLWTVFTGFLFTSFVGAGLQRFNLTLGYIRGVQGRINEILLLLHTHCIDPKDKAFAAVLRLVTALPFILYSPPQFGHGDYFLMQAAQYLSEDQFDRLNSIPNAVDRPFAAILWINRIVLESLQRDPNSSHPPPFTDPYASFSMRLTDAVERLRALYASLFDSLDDAIVPFPFANLIICNIYLVFAGLPFALVHKLGFGLVPAGSIYFWFLDGMVTFVFLVDQPFDHRVAGRKNISQPLIDLHKAIEESVASAPRRFPAGLYHQPKYHYEEGHI